MTGRLLRRRGVTRVSVAAVSVLVATGAAATATDGFGLSRGGSPSKAQSDLPPGSAQISRETLVDTQEENGELSYGDATTLAARLPGTLTGLPMVGTTVKRGQALYRADDSPVVLLYGAMPTYRNLTTGTEGADVKQFEQNLRALGYTGFTVDDEYTKATAKAVKNWQEDLGLPETGAVELGRVVYAPGAVRIDTHKAALGEQLQPGANVLAYTGTTRVITVELDMADQRLAKQGAAVTVTLPDGKTVPGKIAQTATMVDTGTGTGTGSGAGDGGDGASGGGSDPQTKLEVTITVADQQALAGLDQATVDVSFAVGERKDVLTVPVAALLALAEGGYGLQVVDGTSTRIIAVETGLFASGRVEVAAAELAEGMKVGMPS